MSIATEDVERGAALMDEVKPGWLSIVDLGRLNMGSPSRCIAGQVFAKEGAVVKGCVCCCTGWDYALGLTEGVSVEYGFSERGPLDATRDAWVALIEARRATDGEGEAK